MLMRRTLGIVGGLLFIALALPHYALGQTMDEYQVKAGFVSSFAGFVDWPSETFKDPHDPIAICVLGRNPFGHSLADLLETKAVGDRSLIERDIADVREANSCQILFVASSERLRFRAILASLKDRSVFSIGDAPDFLADGGVANLRVENGKVRIEINAGAATKKNLRISSRLMQLVKVVK
jgi:hypothetical protein